MNFGLGFYQHYDRFGLRLINWFIPICFRSEEFGEPFLGWGFFYSDSSLHFRWGRRTKIFWMPWDWGANIRNEVQNEKGRFVPASDVLEGIARRALIKAGVDRNLLFGIKIPDGRKMYESSYRYVLRNGEVQERTAKYYVEEREWRWRIFHPFAIGPKKIHRSISIEFDKEVGEGTSSWKGGCVGCSFEMLPGETPEQTLRRMEKERKFSR